VRRGWDELPGIRAPVCVLMSCMSEMNAVYNSIMEGFNAAGSWWVDSGMVGSTAWSILGKQSGGTWAHDIKS